MKRKKIELVKPAVEKKVAKVKEKARRKRKSDAKKRKGSRIFPKICRIGLIAALIAALTSKEKEETE